MKKPISEIVIHAKLNELQFEHVERYILIRQIPVGLGGQISTRLEGLLLALALQRKAVFQFPDDPPYIQVFEQQYASLPNEIPWETAIPLDLFSDQSADNFLVYGPDDFPSRREPWAGLVNRLVAEKLSMEKIDSIFLDGAILSWMKLVAAVKDYSDKNIIRFGIDDNTLGVHFRRGDKTVETAYVPAEIINNYIAKLCKEFSFRSVYLASDSVAALEEIKLPQGVELKFDYAEKRYNNANHKMLISNPSLAEQETLTAYKNIALLSACGGIIGQDNAHFAKLSAAAIANRTFIKDSIVLIDGRIAEHNSLLLRIVFYFRRNLRAKLRYLFPFLTIKSRVFHSRISKK